MSDHNLSKKNRLRVGGKAVSSPEEVKKAIFQLICTSPKTTGDLVEATGYERTTIYRYCTALMEENLIVRDGDYYKKTGAGQQVVEAAKIEAMSQSEFWQLPMMHDLVQHCKDLEGGSQVMSAIYSIMSGRSCKAFKIHPANWRHPDTTKEFAALYKQEHQTDRLGAHIRKAIRYFYSLCLKIKLTEMEAVALGIDGKKDNIGENADVKLSDEQIDALAEFYLQKGNLEMGAYTYFAIETFGRPNRVFEALLEDFAADKRTIDKAMIDGFATPIYDKTMIQILQAIRLLLPADKQHHIKIEQLPQEIISGKLYESKTDKTWQKFILNPKAISVLKQWQATRKGTKKWFGNPEETWIDFNKRINAMLREGYKALGLKHPYFYERPSYALRHCGAHLWLRRTGYNYGAVAAMGWEDLSTLRTWYGAFDINQLAEQLKREW